MPKKKVLFFLPPSVGGAERVTITIAKMLDRVSFDVHFVIVGRDRGVIAGLIPEGYPIHLVKVRNIWCFATSKICRLLHQERPDGVFCSMRYLNPRVILAAKRTGGIKTIVRNDNTLNTVSAINRFLIGRTYPKADIVIAQQEEMRKEILHELHLDPTKVVAIHNPIDKEIINTKVKDAVSPYTIGGVHYVCVGRIGRHKGQDVLAEAFRIVLESVPEAHLYFVGPYQSCDAYYQQLRAQIETYQMSGHVHFVGYTDNPYVWIKYADCFVLSSRNEGLPNVLLEALYLGTPSVATRCIPVIERIVDDRKTGLLVPSENVKCMADAMLEIRSLKLEPYQSESTDEQFITLLSNEMGPHENE